jgi:hypothetical protein
LNGLPLRCEFERTRAKPANSWEAYDCYLQASDPFTAFDTSLKHDASLIEIERAVALNPNYMNWQFGAALILAGRCVSIVGPARLSLEHLTCAQAISAWL